MVWPMPQITLLPLVIITLSEASTMASSNGMSLSRLETKKLLKRRFQGYAPSFPWPLPL